MHCFEYSHLKITWKLADVQRKRKYWEANEGEKRERKQEERKRKGKSEREREQWLRKEEGVVVCEWRDNVDRCDPHRECQKARRLFVTHPEKSNEDGNGKLQKENPMISFSNLDLCVRWPDNVHVIQKLVVKIELSEPNGIEEIPGVR
jgi:hypothetical protein